MRRQHWATPLFKTEFQGPAREAVEQRIKVDGLDVPWEHIASSGGPQVVLVGCENGSQPLGRLTFARGGNVQGVARSLDSEFAFSFVDGTRIRFTHPTDKPQKAPALSTLEGPAQDGVWILGRHTVEHRSHKDAAYPQFVRRWEVLDRDRQNEAALVEFQVILSAQPGDQRTYLRGESDSLNLQNVTGMREDDRFPKSLSPKDQQFLNSGQELGWDLNYPETAKWIAKLAKLDELKERVKWTFPPNSKP